MIQWYPGHMAKAIKEMENNIKLVDLVINLIDARIPFSSINPKLKELSSNKKVLYVFTKQDKADPVLSNKWLKYFNDNIGLSISIDARNNKCIKDIMKCVDILMKDKYEKDAKKGLKKRSVKTMIVGIPNVGKSTLINTLCGKKVAKTGDKPGVTKSEQWTRINDSLDLLDTPGVLWPKFDDEKVAMNLLITGAIKDEIVSHIDVAYYFIDYLMNYYHDSLFNRYHLSTDKSKEEILIDIANNLHFLFIDKTPDIDKTSLYIIQEYRNMYLGRITLDRI